MRIDRPVFMSGGAFELSLPRLPPFPRVLLATVHRESSRCGLGLLRYTRYPGVPSCSFSIFCIICTCLCTVTGISDNLVDVLHLRNLHGVHHIGILYLLHRWHQSLRIDRDIFHSVALPRFLHGLNDVNLALPHAWHNNCLVKCAGWVTRPACSPD